jgi:hypothetical protein
LEARGNKPDFYPNDPQRYAAQFCAANNLTS